MRKRRSLLSSLRPAWKGLRLAWGEPNVRRHAAAAGFVVTLGGVAGLGRADWLWLTLAMALVIVTEILNTGVEATVDWVSGGRQHPLAGRAKDLAAAAVLVAAVTGVIVGLLVFAPYGPALGARLGHSPAVLLLLALIWLFWRG